MSLTLVAEDASPVGITDTLPGRAVAVTVLAARVGGALVAELALPAWPTSKTDKIIVLNNTYKSRFSPIKLLMIIFIFEMLLFLFYTL